MLNNVCEQIFNMYSQHEQCLVDQETEKERVLNRLTDSSADTQGTSRKVCRVCQWGEIVSLLYTISPTPALLKPTAVQQTVSKFEWLYNVIYKLYMFRIINCLLYLYTRIS